MDEIDKLNRLKKYILILLIVFIIFFITFALVFRGEYIVIALDLSMIFFLFINLPVILAYFFLRMKYKNSRNIFRTLENITREVLKVYSPAICSLLFNKKIEAYSDYSATILYLEQKGYIKIEKNNEGYLIKDLKKDINLLSNHEKYVWDCICNNKRFDMTRFKNKVINDALELDLIKKEQIKIDVNPFVNILIIALIVIISLIVVFTCIYIYVTYPEIVIPIILIIAIGLKWLGNPDVQIESEYTLTKKGKEIKNHVTGLRNYIKEYTLLNERRIEEKEIFESYIAYALSLGEGKTVEKFVSNNKQYRNLIYKK